MCIRDSSSLDWEIGGMAEKDAETLPQVTSGVMIAALIIFFILLFHFQRISLALVNLSSMSLCIFGAAIGLLVKMCIRDSSSPKHYPWILECLSSKVPAHSPGRMG